MPNDYDLQLLRVAIDVAAQSRAQGNHPFGAVLGDAGQNILLQAENSVVTSSDCTGHAETNLVRQACQKYDGEFLATCTMYASTEPCPMCSGAIYWSNIGRVVFGLGQERLYEMTETHSGEAFILPCRDVLGKGQKRIEVVGPLLEAEAAEVHRGFWGRP